MTLEEMIVGNLIAESSIVVGDCLEVIEE